jgi:hypothetical protein
MIFGYSYLIIGRMEPVQMVDEKKKYQLRDE